jgi:hypothetical protein
MRFVLLMTFMACEAHTVTCGEGTHLDGDTCVADEDDYIFVPRTTSSTHPHTTSTQTGSSTTSPSTSTTSTSTTTPSTTSTSTPSKDRTIHVYLVAGQSNASGVGQVNSLPAALQLGQPDVNIYWSQEPWWKPLSPASEYTSGALAYFGPEVTFGRGLADVGDGTPIAIIKHSVGGTDLADFWNPGESPSDPDVGTGYQVFYDTVSNGLDALIAEGWEPEVRGMAWMQGESDACWDVWADAYESNLTHFIARVREDVRTPTMPFVAGLIDCVELCGWRETVREATLNVADADANVYTVETEDLGTYPYDGWHYQGTGMRVLGYRFAASLTGQPIPDMPHAAIRITGGASSPFYGDYTVGWSFELDRAVTITDLGRYDHQLDGLPLGAEVTLWDDATLSRLLSVWVPGLLTADTSVHDNFRYAGVDPFWLEAGRYTLTTQTYFETPDDYFLEADIEQADGFTYLEGRHQSGTAVVYPPEVSYGTTDAALWFGPNLLIFD